MQSRYNSSMEKRLYNYRVIIEQDERTGTNELAYTAYVPTLGIATDGDTIDLALTNAQEAIEAYVGSLIDDKEEVPEDSPDCYLVANTKVRV